MFTQQYNRWCKCLQIISLSNLISTWKHTAIHPWLWIIGEWSKHLLDRNHIYCSVMTLGEYMTLTQQHNQTTCTHAILMKSSTSIMYHTLQHKAQFVTFVCYQSSHIIILRFLSFYCETTTCLHKSTIGVVINVTCVDLHYQHVSYQISRTHSQCFLFNTNSSLKVAFTSCSTHSRL